MDALKNDSKVLNVLKSDTKVVNVLKSDTKVVNVFKSSSKVVNVFLSTEMLMPWETFGSEFITLAIGTRISLSYFIVLAGQDYSEVNIYNSEQHPESYVLRKRGDFLMVRHCLEVWE